MRGKVRVTMWKAQRLDLVFGIEKSRGGTKNKLLLYLPAFLSQISQQPEVCFIFSVFQLIT